MRLSNDRLQLNVKTGKLFSLRPHTLIANLIFNQFIIYILIKKIINKFIPIFEM